MRYILLSLLLVALLACAVRPIFDPSVCPDANRIAASDRREFEVAVAEAAYIFVGTLVDIDYSWTPGGGLAIPCLSMEFAVDRVIRGSPLSRRIVLDYYMDPAPWIEMQKNGLRHFSPHVLQTSQQYLVVGSSQYRFCMRDDMRTIWASTPSNLQALMDAMPIPISEASEPPTLEHRDALGYWPWSIKRPEFNGTLGLSAVVTQSGYTARIKVTHSLVPDMDKDIITWVLDGWHYRPGTRTGRPVAVELPLSVPVVDGVPVGLNEPGMSPNPPLQPSGQEAAGG